MLINLQTTLSSGLFADDVAQVGRHAAAYPSCCPLIPAQRSRGRINTSRTSKRAQRAFGVPESVSLCCSAGRTARATRRRLLWPSAAPNGLLWVLSLEAWRSPAVSGPPDTLPKWPPGHRAARGADQHPGPTKCSAPRWPLRIVFELNKQIC